MRRLRTQKLSWRYRPCIYFLVDMTLHNIKYYHIGNVELPVFSVAVHYGILEHTPTGLHFYEWARLCKSHIIAAYIVLLGIKRTF